MVRKALYKAPSTGGPVGRVILPNPKLIGCSTTACPPVLPDGKDSRSVYPWQVSLDYNNGSVIGLTALYDDPTTLKDVKAVIDERYGKWAWAANVKMDGGSWRVEPENFVIGLSTNDTGMVQVIYLSFDPKHPTSERVRKQILDRMAKAGKQ